MICPICKKSIKRLIKEIDDIRIYQCDRCLLALFDKQKRTTNELYSFNDYQTQEKKLERRLTNLGKIVSRFIKKGKILDVGAGFGQFSSVLDKMGKFSLNIVEPSIKQKYLLNKKFTLHKLTYEMFLTRHLRGVEAKYNLILMMDILEHFKDPFQILKKTNKLLSKNGYLVIQTPNYKSLMAKVCKNWSWWMVEDHKMIFSPKSLLLLLNKAGYKTVYFKTYEDLYDFKKNLDGNFTNKFEKGIFYLIFFPFYFIFRHLIWHFGYGGAIFLIAKQYNKY